MKLTKRTEQRNVYLNHFSFTRIVDNLEKKNHFYSFLCVKIKNNSQIVWLKNPNFLLLIYKVVKSKSLKLKTDYNVSKVSRMSRS